MNFFENLFDINKSSNFSVTGLNKELNSIFVSNFFKKYQSDILVLTNSLYEANEIYNRLLCYNENILFFPMDDFAACESSVISPEFMIERLSCINSTFENNPKIVVTNLMGILRYLPNKQIYLNNIVKLKIGVEVEREELIKKFIKLSYENVPLVTKTGEFSVRGYVIDIFPLNFDNPIRIELWGDNIESIKYFDLDSQISNKEIDNVNIYPFTEFLVNKELNINEEDRLQKYLPCFDDNVVSIYDYLNNPILIYYDFNQIKTSFEILSQTISDYDKELAIHKYETKYMFDLNRFNNLKSIYLLDKDNLIEEKIYNFSFQSYNIENYSGNFEKIKVELNNYLQKNFTIIFCIEDKNIVKRLIFYLEMDQHIIFTNENNIILGKINIINKYIETGFIYNKYVVLSINDIFGKKEERKKHNSRYKIGTKISNLNNLNKGDYIVHIDHGIGQYLELTTLDKNGIKKDYIKLIYADGDLLYLPVEKIDKITKYNGKEGAFFKLDKLGTDGWQKRKIRIKNKLENIAQELISVSAKREALLGYAFSKDDENQILFDSKFKYNPTTDQLNAIEKIKNAMELNKPMDMLLCGDVGYGKTEVAFRAIFKAVNDGKQACYLCPTTILSSQQYTSAIKRFEDFPINIALLNRFTSTKDENIILKKLLEGRIDILFGTHKLLNDKIKFKDLGLLVIDEEQRFGVAHKEKIKQYKNNVDVLTLSATPIPRTLQMSMTGLKEIAILETPPEKRHPIQTYVMPYNSNIIKDAIYKELTRSGQIFVLYNNIDKLEEKKRELLSLIPGVTIKCAHGKMNKIELENIMAQFINHEFDLLLCTTIIETGIDISNVNTLIIIDSDKFGLSQLYQIRGRIGRSDRIGYAYLMYDNKKIINDTAIKRLDSIKEFSSLGSGFKIAMRDLSIRGAGDILGSEQSGFIDSIGIDLYLKMLKDEINKLKGEKVEEEEENNLPLLEVDTHISDNYVPDDEIKLEIHKLINEVSTYQDIEKLKDILVNRFGIVTDEMIIYMHEELFEKQAKLLKITESKQTKQKIEIALPSDVSSQLSGDKLFYKIYEISPYFKLSYKNKKIYIMLDISKLEKHFIFYLNNLLNEIMKMLSL